MTFGPIPVVLATSGHRDLLDTEITSIREALHAEFTTLRKQYPGTRFQLLNGLAEGADWLIAEIALEHRIELMAVLPMPQAEYERDFSTPETLAKFRLLLSKAAEVQVAPMPRYLACDSSRDASYQALGICLAQQAQRLYALWDGSTENSLPGGTADVVRLCREGIESEDNPLAQPETCQVRHLRCNRKKNLLAYTAEDASSWAPTITDAAIGTRKCWSEIFQSIEDFNQAAIKIQEAAPHEIVESRQWLTGEANYPSVIESSLQTFAIADALSRSKQKQRSTTLWLLSLLVFLSIFFQQLHLGPDMQWYWLTLHIGFGLIAFASYRAFFSGTRNSEAQYMDWRALAEGLRVQACWQAAGIDECASKYYLSSQNDELGWIRYAIQNITKTGNTALTDCDFPWVKSHWLEDQKKFFLSGGSSAASKQQKVIKWMLYSRFLFFAGGTTTLLLLLKSIASVPSQLLPWLTLFAAILFVLAAICRNHSNLMAYEEDANRYQKMGNLFDRAIIVLNQHIEAGNSESARSILKLIGKEALAENGEWLLLHRQRKFELPT